MKFFIFIFILLFSNQGYSAPKDMKTLNWLTGVWRGTASWGQPVDLIISKPNKTRLLASETTFENLKRNRISSFEHFEIRKRGDLFELEVFPKGQKNLILKSIKINAQKIVFENQSHDFPKIWGFELLPSGRLREFASGAKQKVEILYKKEK